MGKQNSRGQKRKLGVGKQRQLRVTSSFSWYFNSLSTIRDDKQHSTVNNAINKSCGAIFRQKRVQTRLGLFCSFFIISSVRRQTSHRSLKNEQPRCSPPYELLCAPLPFGWLRQVRYRVSNRVFNVMVFFGWYLLRRPPAKKSIFPPSALSRVRVLFVWWLDTVHGTELTSFASSPSLLLPGRIPMCGVVYIGLDFAFRAGALFLGG